MSDAIGDMCAALCGGCCILFESSMQSWCDTKAFGQNGCCCRCGGSRGCCPNCGGFDDQDGWDAEDAKRRKAEMQQQADVGASGVQAEPSTQDQQPAASKEMTTDVPAH